MVVFVHVTSGVYMGYIWGSSVGALGELLGTLLARLGVPGDALGGSLGPRGVPGRSQERFGIDFGSILGRFGAHFRSFPGTTLRRMLCRILFISVPMEQVGGNGR